MTRALYGIKCITDERFFDSVNQASKFYGIQPFKIYSVINGHQKVCSTLDGDKLEFKKISLEELEKEKEKDIKSLAKMAGVSQSQFERRFNRIFGTTPYEYLLRVRIAAARALLENSERTIADIACETGFYDHSHFTRTFKRIVGISPGRYRAIHSAVGM